MDPPDDTPLDEVRHMDITAEQSVAKWAYPKSNLEVVSSPSYLKRLQSPRGGGPPGVLRILAALAVERLLLFS